MEAVYICGMITVRNSCGKQEIFPIKISSEMRQCVEKDLGARSRLAEEFGIRACKQLGSKLQNCRVSIMKPSGESYQVFLKFLERFSEQDLAGITIDLMDFQHKSDA